MLDLGRLRRVFGLSWCGFRCFSCFLTSSHVDLRSRMVRGNLARLHLFTMQVQNILPNHSLHLGGQSPLHPPPHQTLVIVFFPVLPALDSHFEQIRAPNTSVRLWALVFARRQRASHGDPAVDRRLVSTLPHLLEPIPQGLLVSLARPRLARPRRTSGTAKGHLRDCWTMVTARETPNPAADQYCLPYRAYALSCSGHNGKALETPDRQLF